MGPSIGAAVAAWGPFQATLLTLRDFLLLCVICFAWGSNLVVSRYTIGFVPPVFLAALRFFCLFVLLSPWLWPPPRKLGTVIMVGAFSGGLNFVLNFIALKHGQASSVAIANQLSLPFTVILSTMFLGEKINPRRGFGMVMTFVGVLIIAFKPGQVALSLGVMLAVGAAFIASVATIMMKKMEAVPLLKLQAWVGLASFPILTGLSLAFEQQQIESAQAMGWAFGAAMAYSVLTVSVWANTLYYGLVQRYDMTLLAPLILMGPVWTVVLSTVFLKEPLTAQLLTATAIVLTGVALVAIPDGKLGELVRTFRQP